MQTEEVLARVDLDLLDQQITTLGVLEVSDTIQDSDREDISGLLNFLSLLWDSMKKNKG